MVRDLTKVFLISNTGSGNSLEMEEERRNCFVAITRTIETLTLSYTERYRGWLKEPSRFLFEMGLLSDEPWGKSLGSIEIKVQN